MAWSKLSRHKRGYGAAHVKRRAYLLAHEPLCRECIRQGNTTLATICDHIIPKSQGGTDDMNNLQPLCTDCHDEKTARESAQAQGRVWRKRISYGPDGWPI